MSIATLLHDKLIADFATLQFEGGATVFNNVRKFYAAGSMEAGDCVLLPDSTPEIVEGQSAGNFQTTRVYTFRAVAYEQIEATDSNAAGSLKYSRLLNTEDALLNYLQKEPSNLNAWGSSNSIGVYKIRVSNVFFDTQQSEGGYAAFMQVTFSVYVNVVPQNL